MKPGIVFTSVFLYMFFYFPHNSWALQEHGAIEGHLVHLGAHIMLFIAMCDFSYRVVKTELFAPLSRRYLFVGGFLLCLWNLWAFAGHIIASKFVTSPFAHQRGDILGGRWAIMDAMDLVYYFLKMDDLLLAPAIVCFFLASRQILRDIRRG